MLYWLDCRQNKNNGTNKMDVKVAKTHSEAFQVYFDNKPIGKPQSERAAKSLARFLVKQVVEVIPGAKQVILLE